MAAISAKVQERLISGLKKFQQILNNAKNKDINEADTVIILIDLFNELLGYDKYSEITSERKTNKGYCDLTIKNENKIKFIVEVKAVALELKPDNIKQIIDYGIWDNVEWLILTNGITWQVYKLYIKKPIDWELIFQFNFLELNPKKTEDLETLFFLTKEGIGKSALEEFHIQKQTINRYTISYILQTEDIVDHVRKDLRKLFPDIKVQNDEIKKIIMTEILKRDLIEGEKVDETRKKLSKLFNSLNNKQ